MQIRCQCPTSVQNSKGANKQSPESWCLQAPDIDSDLFVEVLGILVNVDIPSYDWPALIAKHDLLNLLAGLPPTPTVQQ